MSSVSSAGSAGAAGVPGWVHATSAWSPAPSADGRTLAFVSDRDGSPRVWLAPLGTPAQAHHLVAVQTGPHPVQSVRWAPGGGWLCLGVAPGGGERTQVWAVRPDGSELHALGGTTSAATLGHWEPHSAVAGLSEAGGHLGPHAGDTDAYAVEVSTGARRHLATGPASLVCDIAPGGGRALVRVGRRGEREVLLVDLRGGGSAPVLRGGLLGTCAEARFAPDGRTVLLHTDAGRELAALLAIELDGDGRPRDPQVRAERADAELERFAVTVTGAVVLVWNAAGRSEVEVLGTDGVRRPVGLPADVVTGCEPAADGAFVLLCAEGPATPGRVWAVPLDPAGAPGDPVPATPEEPAWEPAGLVHPELVRYAARDGLPLSGWLYRPRGATGAVPVVLWLHGGPESQERPAFAPLLQAVAAAGVAVFAPNVRGSSGSGRSFVEADNGDRRFAAVTDVADTVRHLVAAGIADPDRVAVAGRSYGGWLTLAALCDSPELFRAGVDVCGVVDFETFYRTTEPWIAESAVGEYGHPVHDRDLLRALSPIHRIDRLAAPLLVVHGAQDTNVPVGEAEQVVAALRARGVPSDYLLFSDEGHEVKRTANRVLFVRRVVDWLTGHLLDGAVDGGGDGVLDRDRAVPVPAG